MTEQVENQAVEPVSDWVEVGAEPEVVEQVETETAAEESADVELIIDGQAVSPTADDDVNLPDDAPNWAKELRTKYKETARKAAELEKQLQQANPVDAEPDLKERPMPQWEDKDVEFDPDKMKAAMDAWTKEQIAIEKQRSEKQQSQKAEQQEIEQSVKRYNEAKARTSAREPDYLQAESAVVAALSVPAQVMLMQLADDASALVLAAGRNDGLLKELAALQNNPVKFAFKIGALNKSVSFAPKTKQQFKPEPTVKAATSKPQSADDARFSKAFPDAQFK